MWQVRRHESRGSKLELPKGQTTKYGIYVLRTCHNRPYGTSAAVGIHL